MAISGVGGWLLPQRDAFARGRAEGPSQSGVSALIHADPRPTENSKRINANQPLFNCSLIFFLRKSFSN